MQKSAVQAIITTLSWDPLLCNVVVTAFRERRKDSAADQATSSSKATVITYQAVSSTATVASANHWDTAASRGLSTGTFLLNTRADSCVTELRK